MIVTFKINTDLENYDPCELEQLKHAGDMAAALYHIQDAVLGWYRHGSGAGRPLNADTLHEIFYDILDENNVHLDKLFA